MDKKDFDKIDHYHLERMYSEKVEMLSKLTDFWFKEDIKQGLTSTQDSDFDIKYDKEINSHMQWHLRDAPLYKTNNNSQDEMLSQYCTQKSERKYSIMICTDFAFPKFGGVETHGYQLAQCLIERGHKVCFITNKF